MSDVQTPDNTPPGKWERREKDLLDRSIKVQQMMKLFEDQEFLNAAQKLTGISDANEAVPVLVTAHARLANLDQETASTIISALAESVLNRNVQQPFDVLQTARAKEGLKMANAWSEATQKMYVETLAKNNVIVKPITPPTTPSRP